MATHTLKILQCEQSYQVYRVTLNKNINIDFQKAMTTSFFEVIKFLTLLARASLADSKIILQNNFAKNNSTGTKQERNFTGLWQLQKQLKTMEIKENLLDVYDESKSINQFQPEPTPKLEGSSRCTYIKDILSMNIS